MARAFNPFTSPPLQPSRCFLRSKVSKWPHQPYHQYLSRLLKRVNEAQLAGASRTPWPYSRDLGNLK